MDIRKLGDGVLKVIVFITAFGVCHASEEGSDIKDVKNLQTIVVTASKAPVAVEESASAITVIDSEEIADKQYTNVADALRSVPGVDVRRQGGYGSTTSIRMRGLHQRYTMVMIDGVKVLDATGVDRAADLTLLSTNNVERIEVVRGNQNTLHGTSAIGGVINIITKKAEKGEKLSGSVFSEYGSNNTIRYGGNFGTATNKVNMNFGVNRETSDNISNADMNIDGVDERDEFRNTTFSTNIGILPEEIVSFNISARYNDGFFEYDNGAGADKPANDGPGEHETERNEFYGRGETIVRLFDNRWKQVAGVNYTNIYRDTYTETDTEGDYFKGEVINIDYKNILELHETNTLSFGFDTQEEINRQGDRAGDNHVKKSTVRSNSYFIEDQLRFWDKWFTTVGLRVEDHDTYHQHTTWKASTSYLIEKTNTTIKGSYATGFYSPTLYNLYDSTWVNANVGLQPERSRSWEVGFDQEFMEGRFNLGAVFFKNHVKNQIAWDPWPASRYINLNKVSSEGIEVTASAIITENLDATASYTYTDAKQLEPTRDIAFMPNNRATLTVNYKILDNISSFATVNYTGSCYNGTDASNPWAYRSNDTRFQSHTLLDFGVNWDINKTFRLYGKCENATDREYQEQPGYGTFGRTFTIGARASF